MVLKFLRLMLIIQCFAGCIGTENWFGSQALAEQPAASQAKADNKEDIASPRYMFRQFLNVMKRDDLDAAFTYIEFPRRLGRESKRKIARQLIDVLNKKGQIDVTDLSNEPNGRLTDGLRPDFEVIGKVDVKNSSIAVTLVQLTEDDHKVWRFAPEFIDRIPSLAEDMEQSDIEADLPPLLVEHQFRGIKAWQWLGLGLAIVLASLVSRILAIILLRMINLTSRHFKIVLTNKILKGFIPPFRMLTGLAVFHLALNSVDLNLSIRQSVQYGMAVVLTLTLMFLAMRLAEAFIEMMKISFEKQGRPGSVAMLPPTQRGIKVVIVVVGLVFLLRDLGFDVTAIVAGLGVGGLAIALAGQKTIENLFGGISVILDQPVRVGDSGRFGDIIGTVEDIGLRSTRVRTLDRSIVTIPNAEFSHMKLENFEKRDKLRWTTSLTLRFDTGPDQIRLVLIRLKELLIAHPMVFNEPARVRFLRFALNGLELEIFTYIRTTDWNEYLAVIEDLNIRILSVLEECGTALAFATAVVMPEKMEGLHRQKQQEASLKIKEMERSGALPWPLYPQEWIEPRTDTLRFGPEKKDSQITGG